MVKKIIITKRAVLTNDFEQKILNSFYPVASEIPVGEMGCE